MLEETTEIRLEAIWQAMSEDLQKAVISAVDTSLMSDRFPGEKTGAMLARVNESLTPEIENIIAAGATGEPVFAPIIFGRHTTSATGALGKHDERIDDGEGYGFLLSDTMREYVIQRILL